jgi:hypothetical protein
MKTPRILPTLGLTLLACAFSATGYSTGGSSSACSKSDFKGPYGFRADGSILGLSYAELGREVSDGKGKIKGSATQSFDGVIQTVKFSGTYVVNSDCTGTATLSADPGSTASSFMGSTTLTGQRKFVILGDGSQVDYMFADAGTVVVGEGHKMASGDSGDGDDDDHDDDDHDDDDDGHDGHDRHDKGGRVYGKPRRP